MNKFKHSGTTGDIVYSLSLVKYLGGGEFYLHLDQVNSICFNRWGVLPAPFHQGRMNQADYDFMRDFMLAQDYINDFKIFNPQITDLTHNLDDYRPLFNKHCENFIDVYTKTFGIDDLEIQKHIRQTKWITVPSITKIHKRVVAINRTERYLPVELRPQWDMWKNQGLEQVSFFVGLPHEYELFRKTIGWGIPFVETKTMLDLASIIAGCEHFIGNQSQCLSLAVGLGIPFYCELGPKLPGEKNELYFEDLPTANYF